MTSPDPPPPAAPRWVRWVDTAQWVRPPNNRPDHSGTSTGTDDVTGGTDDVSGRIASLHLGRSPCAGVTPQRT